MADAKRRKALDPELQAPRESWTYTPQRVLGRGSFGVVYQATVLETNEIVAIKSIKMQEKDREIQILKELEGHPNVVAMKGAFLSTEGTGETRLNLVLEFLSDTLHRVIKHYNVLRRSMDVQQVRLYTYQLLKGLGFIHGRGIMHTDIKPQNLLLDGKTHTLKLCDFGTARRLAFGESVRPYVCSRFYRAPECILGSTRYSTPVDLWAAGCVLAEMLLGVPLFEGKDGIHQFVCIIQVLGTPSRQELRALNPEYPEYDFAPSVEPIPWGSVFPAVSAAGAPDLAGQLLRFDPKSRTPPLPALAHAFFDPLREESPSKPADLFKFRADELWWAQKPLKERLMPKGAQAASQPGAPKAAA